MKTDEAILVVGGAGYIGTHMVKRLLDEGYRVITLDNLSTGNRELLPGGEIIVGDLGDSILLEKIFSKNQISCVMHFAALSLVGESVAKPLDYYENNVAATIKLIHTMVRLNIQKFIFSSSAAVFGEPEKTPITEEHPRNPTNPYGETKLMVEKILQDCEHSYSFRYVSLRYFNAAGASLSGEIGERHDPETHLIPLVLKVANGEKDSIKIFGNDYATPDRTCIRDYVHVEDLVEAHLLSMHHLESGGESAVYNLGSSNGSSIREVIKTAERVTGKQIPFEEVARRPGDPAVLIASSRKIQEELGWQTKFDDLTKIIESAWNWHMNENKYI